MDGLISRIEVLLFTLLVVASAMLVPVAKPRVEISSAAVSIVDSVLRINNGCSVPINQYVGTLLSTPSMKTYRKRGIHVSAVIPSGCGQTVHSF
jgi:hypothetical protein